MTKVARNGWLVLLVCLASSSFFLAACAPERRYKVLSTFFDGVPTPAERAARDEAKRQAETPPEEPAEVVAAELPEAERPRPPIEDLKTWEEVLAILPKDIYGGPDWVEAIKDGTIEPRIRLKSDPIPTTPFTLDTLVPAALTERGPALELDIPIVPEQAPFYEVRFPHSSHTLWLNCSSCHTGIVAERGSGMGKIFAGEYCGKCHGKVSFEPLTSCARCHVNLVPASPEEIEADLAEMAQNEFPEGTASVEQGKAVYLQACAICHGEEGDGKGPLGPSVNPKPRDFTSGKYKFRTTNSSSIPTDWDLYRTITKGIQGTSMPSFSMLPREDREALVQFVKTFSQRFTKEEPEEPIEMPDPLPNSPEMMAMGKQFYMEAECNKCHGEQGRGDGPSAPELEDDWGDPLRPFDFTSGRPKNGSTLKDYYRDVMTGLVGSPMPDYGDVFEQDQIWAVIHYVYSLGDAKRNLPPHVKGDIYFQRLRENPAPPQAGPQANVQQQAPEQEEEQAQEQPQEQVQEPVQEQMQAQKQEEEEVQEGEPEGALEQLAEEEVPPATFPHWFHRMRVRCAVCHPAIFEMKAGANKITMDDIRAGQFCGRCHPSYPDADALAWLVSFESCVRCHVAQ